MTKTPDRKRRRTRREQAQGKVFDDNKQTVCPECGSEELIVINKLSVLNVVLKN